MTDQGEGRSRPADWVRLSIPLVLYAGCLFNYAAALSRVAPRPFLVGTALGIIPGTLAAALVGDRVIAGFHGDGARPFLIAALVAFGLLVLTFLPAMLGRFKD